MNYSLAALHKVREHKKVQAENGLKEAIHTHDKEKNKLEQIKNTLADALVARERLQTNFFLKSRLSGYNKSELSCHAFSTLKNQGQEESLKKRVLEQEEAVRFAAMKLTIAQSQMLEAHRNLKLIEKHYDSWKRSQYLAEQISEEKANDDLNGATYIQKKGMTDGRAKKHNQ